MRIRRRLTLYGVFVTALTMLGFGLLLTALASGSVPQDQDRNLAALADVLLATSPELDDPETVPGLPLPIDLGSSTDVYMAIYDATGVALNSTGTVAGENPSLPAAIVVEAIETGTSVATVQAGPGAEARVHARGWPTKEGGTAVLVVGQSTAFLDEQLGGLNAVIWIAAILAMVASMLVSWLVSGRALRPLRELAETTDEIGRTGDLSRRLPPVDTPDEVGALTESFNSMLEQLESTNSQLSDTLVAQRRFVADASHELRSPLTTIRSNAGFLADRPDAALDDRTEAIDDISAEAARMARLVEDLLTLAVRDASEETAAVPVEIDQILKDLRPRADALQQDVVWSSTSHATVHGDRDALTRLVWILIDNASRHGATEIVVAAVDHPTDVSIVVTDNGPGFPPEDLKRVFERFYRVDAARSPSGSGLGLSIADAVTQAHRGTISAANGPQGAIVTVTLPVMG
ncbi:MAG: HAMP domain-containing histidine kinase [Acidimicrobiia bacterium]|nr:HAMP domain-containing histidine kinase [Acidimicrobiia bacterium]